MELESGPNRGDGRRRGSGSRKSRLYKTVLTLHSPLVEGLGCERCFWFLWRCFLLPLRCWLWQSGRVVAVASGFPVRPSPHPAFGHLLPPAAGEGKSRAWRKKHQSAFPHRRAGGYTPSFAAFTDAVVIPARPCPSKKAARAGIPPCPWPPNLGQAKRDPSPRSASRRLAGMTAQPGRLKARRVNRIACGGRMKTGPGAGSTKQSSPMLRTGEGRDAFSRCPDPLSLRVVEALELHFRRIALPGEFDFPCA